jgi:Undecaprenyl-phosphate glucose phosphotransferase
LLGSLDFPHLRFIGIADDRSRDVSVRDLPMLGDLPALCELARKGEVDQVLISGAHFSPKRLEQIVEGLSEVCVDVSLIPAQAIELAPNYRVNLLGTVPVLTLWQRPFRDMNRLVKRTEDIALSGLALILLSPVLLVTALLVRLSSPGPVVFVQPRVGFNNEAIRVFKFRTMYADMADLGAKQTTTRDDPRVTPVGRVLRRFSIDELPQLFNVLRGSMSLVGPRPHGTEMMVGDRFYHEAVRGYAGRHRVKPGITGYAQVKGLRGEVRTIERAKRRVELDKYYVDHWSFWLDMWILFATARAVLFDRDAY